MTNIEKAVNAAYEELLHVLDGDAYNAEEEMEYTLGDYLMDALDVDYRISSSGECIGVRVWVQLGGPTVWIDTEDATIRGAWGNDRAAVPLPYDAAQEIQEYAWNLRGCFLD